MMIYDMVASGKRLKALRKQAGKTQEQVAEAVGLEPGTISRIERGVKGMSIDSLLMFSEIQGVSTDYILKGDETMTPSDALLEELEALVQKYKSLQEIKGEFGVGKQTTFQFFIEINNRRCYNIVNGYYVGCRVSGKLIYKGTLKQVGKQIVDVRMFCLLHLHS